MPLNSVTRINHVLAEWPAGTVGLVSWLEARGVSRARVHRYARAGWLDGLGRGAVTRGGERVDWRGGLYALQAQAGLPVHAGGRTALSLQGQAHALELDVKTVQLFAPRGVRLPPWFRGHDWGVRPELHRTDFLPPGPGLVDVEAGPFSVRASGAARALMECLYLAPEGFELVEAAEIMEGLTALRPAAVQGLLEACRSVKVKRLFLFLAGRAGHAWARHLDPGRVDTGRGKRSLAAGGAYVPKYQMTVPRELASP